MSYLLTVTLKDGNVLTREISDTETLDLELRFIQRQRRARWGIPSIFWRTVDGRSWCFAATQIMGAVQVSEAPAAEAVAS